MKIGYLIALLFILLSCNSIKRGRLISGGEVLSETFFDSTHFEFNKEFPIIEAKIDGETYRFLFDTGAPNVVSKILAEKLNLKTKATGWVSDSGGNVSKKKYVKIDEVRIGNTTFLNSGAAVVDLKSAHKINCLNIDGIIGANLMRKAHWKMDYINQTLWFSNELENLELNDKYKQLPFKPRYSGTPLVKLVVNKTDSVKMVIDTGSNGNLTLPYPNYKRPKNKKDIHYFVGTSTYGISGKAKADTTFYLKSNHFKLGGISYQNKILQYRGDTDLIGNKFLKNHTIIFDWKKEILYLKPHSEFDYESINHFGFKLDLENNKMVVSALFNNSKAANIIKLGDQILRIDEMDFSNFSNEEFCKYSFQNTYNFQDRNQIHLKIMRDKTILEFDLEKETLVD